VQDIEHGARSVPMPVRRLLQVVRPVRAAPASAASMPWVSGIARIYQRWLTRTDASPPRHRDFLPAKSNSSGRDFLTMSEKRASYDDVDIGEAAQPAFLSKQAVKRRKRHKISKKLYQYVRHA
jgi:hypothetical protein